MKSFILKCKMELESYWKKLYFSTEQQQEFYNKYNFFDESNINFVESEGESNANDEDLHNDNNKIEEIISTIDINTTNNNNNNNKNNNNNTPSNINNDNDCNNNNNNNNSNDNDNKNNNNNINNQSIEESYQNKNINNNLKEKKKNFIKLKKYSDEEILAAYEKEIVKMEKLYDEAKDVLELVGKHIRLVEEVKNFEISCADQNRLFQKGKRDPGRLLREEKFRKRIARERPK
eukprot:jgi/Orpsp1_1/1185668/evm.model.c7180000094798.2